MKLSFVIPAHNEELYIGKCLDSIVRELKRSPHDVEVIVVDNASTDRTKDIAARYSGVRLVYEPQKGLVRARRAGFLAATGDLIANVDADTMLTPGWIENAFRAFHESPKLVCLSGPFIYYDLPKGIRVLVKMFYGLGFLVYLMNRFILRRASVVQGGNFVLRASALREIGGYNTDIDFYGEDSDIARRLNKAGKVRFTFGFPIFSSGRRLAKEGMFTMGFRYGINYLWIVLFNKPFTKESIEVRPAEEKGAVTYRPESKAREWAIAAGLLSALFAFLAGLAYVGYILIQSGIISATTINKIKAETQKTRDTITTFSTKVQQKIKNALEPNGF